MVGSGDLPDALQKRLGSRMLSIVVYRQAENNGKKLYIQYPSEYDQLS
jgi:hypothetical protein